MQRETAALTDRLTEPNPKLLQLQIEGWEAHATYRFVVTSIPTNTPKDAVIYIKAILITEILVMRTIGRNDRWMECMVLPLWLQMSWW